MAINILSRWLFCPPIPHLSHPPWGCQQGDCLVQAKSCFNLGYCGVLNNIKSLDIWSEAMQVSCTLSSDVIVVDSTIPGCASHSQWHHISVLNQSLHPFS